MKDHLYYIKELDSALTVPMMQNMSLVELNQACFMRGLNAKDLTSQEMIEWLTVWQRFTQQTDDDSLSLLAHGPLFLAFRYKTIDHRESTKKTA